MLGVRPILAHFPSPALWVVVFFALVSAWIAEQFGIHAIFGVFFAGLAMPSEAA